MKSQEFLTEATLTSKVWEIADAINGEISRRVYERLTGKRKTAMGLADEKVMISLIHVKEPSSRVWTRGDGSRYRDPGYIYVDDKYLKALHRKYSSVKTLFPTKESVIDHVWEVLKSKPRSKDLGTVSGEFGSDSHDPALKAGGLLWVRRSHGTIEYGSMSRLNNTSIWRHTPPEGQKPLPKKGDLVRVISNKTVKVAGYKKPIEAGERVEIKDTGQELKIKDIVISGPDKGSIKLSNNRLYQPEHLKFIEPWGYHL